MSGNGSKAINQSAGSRRLAVISSLFAIAFIIALTLSLRDKGSAERSREAQIALSRLEVRVQEVHSLEWLATAAREITPEVEARLRASKRELLTTASGSRLQTRETLVAQFGPAASNFIQATDRQLQLIQNGKFEEARRLDFEEVSQQFDVLQHQVHQASDAEARVTEAAATKSRIELVIAFVLVAASIALLFLRFQRQEQLMLAKQAVLQQSEERFRALTEKSADIVFITDSAGVVNYVSPTIQMVLALNGEVFNGRNLGDFVQPDDISRFQKRSEGCRGGKPNC